ncbi:phosphoribosyl-AMP cyclohydrolase [Oceanospirillum maris]|jgi:phosphoribosyl-AMP cyclohydrolase|uniref:phosphoribosyl-AMP cyclohydrolase n=1 Tax=Oceanospirillum maris TaxID=64977 RepID=UPI00041B75DD|nr:phosphoribosyl-AMP cyclohydrolase [Oceanospirillum maris]
MTSAEFNWKQVEQAELNQTFDLETALSHIKFNEDGLVPAIAQQYDSGEVVMMAWMNLAAIKETLKNQRVCYWSRSRQAYWRKGESSGQVQHLKELRIDCDGDALLVFVDQVGPACHTGRRSCFYAVAEPEGLRVDSEPLIDPAELYAK